MKTSSSNISLEEVELSEEESNSSETCGEKVELNAGDELYTPRSDQSTSDASDYGLFAALDRVGEESHEYWNEITEQKIKEFESYRDAHPCIVTDEERSISVYVDGTGRYKGTSAIKRVAMEDYFSRMMKKEAKATQLCQLMRDCIETLEDALKDLKVKMMKMHRESQRKIEKVRYFWRNKIFEGNSRGGELLKAVLMYPDMYS